MIFMTLHNKYFFFLHSTRYNGKLMLITIVNILSGIKYKFILICKISNELVDVSRELSIRVLLLTLKSTIRTTRH